MVSNETDFNEQTHIELRLPSFPDPNCKYSFAFMEFHIRYILHPTDFSDHAAKALQDLSDLLQIPKTRLVLVHVLEWPPVGGHQSAAELERMKEEKFDQAQQHMKAYVAKVFGMSVPNPQPITEVVDAHQAYKGILDAVQRHDPFLVLMGQKGTSKLKQELLGSTVKHVLEHASCPVLVVP